LSLYRSPVEMDGVNVTDASDSLMRLIINKSIHATLPYWPPY